MELSVRGSETGDSLNIIFNKSSNTVCRNNMRNRIDINVVLIIRFLMEGIILWRLKMAMVITEIKVAQEFA